uniref:Odorant-binding protein 2b-like n=1 Tax=Bos indicus x Bos taurus TaxID=30522 RepID=A0A4W2DRG8_BOBOX
MKALLLPIALSLLAALRAQEPPSCPLEPQQIAGTWYVKAMVTDENLPKEMRPRKVSPVTVTALGGGDLELTFTFLQEARCHEKRSRMQPTGEPGKYSSNGGKKQVHILELPVEGHYILYCEGQRQGKSFHVGKLIGRNPDVNPEALEAFKKFVQRKGFSLEDVFTPEQTGEGPALWHPPGPLCVLFMPR